MGIPASTIRQGVLTVCEPLTAMLGHIHLPVVSHHITEADGKAILKVIQPGDVVLSRIWGAATNLFIPGEWKHAAMFVGPGLVTGTQNLVEAVEPTVHETHFLSWACAHDALLVLRPRFVTEQEAGLAAHAARSLIGCKYDEFFTYSIKRETNRAFYCSEVIWWAYDFVCTSAGRVSPFVPRATMGMDTITPDDFAHGVGKWATVWAKDDA